MFDKSRLLAPPPFGAAMWERWSSTKSTESAGGASPEVVCEEALCISWSSTLIWVPDLFILQPLLERVTPVALALGDGESNGVKYFGLLPPLEGAGLCTPSFVTFSWVPIESTSAIVGSDAKDFFFLAGRKSGGNLPSIARLAFLDFAAEGCVISEDLCRDRTLCWTRFRVRGFIPQASMRLRMSLKSAWRGHTYVNTKNMGIQRISPASTLSNVRSMRFTVRDTSALSRCMRSVTSTASDSSSSSAALPWPTAASTWRVTSAILLCQMQFAWLRNVRC